MSNERDYRFLRKIKAERIRELHRKGLPLIQHLDVQSVHHGIVLPAKRITGMGGQFGCGGVVDESGNYCSLSETQNRISGGYAYQSAEFIDKKVVYCGYAIRHWGHFLLESVNRLWFYLKNDNQSIDEYVFIVDENDEKPLSGNYLEFLRLMGIADKVKLISKPTSYREIIIPQNSFIYNQYYSEAYVATFDAVTTNALKETSDNVSKDVCYSNIYFSRGKFQKAKDSEIGLEMLDNFFQKNGFYILYPEQVELKQMIRLMANAEVCVFPSGTPSHNSLFAPSSAQIVVIEKQQIINKYQTSIDFVKCLNTCYIDANHAPYPITAGGGPFYYAYNKYLKKFSEEFGFCAPDDVFINEKAIKKDIWHYLSLYHRWYTYGWAVEDWQMQWADIIYQAHMDTLEEIGTYLRGEKMLSIAQIFDFSIMKKILVRYVKGIARKVK